MVKRSEKKAVIDKNRCDRSPFCPARRVCPANAIVTEGAVDQAFAFFGPRPSYSINEDQCAGCGVCVSKCPMGAINMR